MPQSAGERRFKYSVITRENGDQFHLLPIWWTNHPNWTVYLRSDVMASSATYLGAGGATFQQAMANLSASVASATGCKTAVGTESEVPIDAERK